MSLPTATRCETIPQSSLLHEVLAHARLTPDDDGYAMTGRGVVALLANLGDVEPATISINKACVDHLIVGIDRQLGQLMDEILHTPALQQLEASWRSLKLLVDRTNFRENIRILVLNATPAMQVLQREIFGPILPILTYRSHEEVVQYINARQHPLALYIYSHDKAVQDFYLQHTLSGTRPLLNGPAGPFCFSFDSCSRLPSKA